MNTSKRLLSTKKSGNLIFLLCFLAYCFSYFGRNNFSTCLNDMKNAGILTPGFDGYISSAFLVCYGAGQFINGRLSGRISPKIMMTCGLTGSGLCNLLMGLTSNQVLYLLMWGLNGYCCSMLWPTVIRTFTSWLTEDERVRAGANISPSIPAGMLGCYLISFIALRISWRYAFIISGVLLCIGGVIWFLGMTFLKNDISARSALIGSPTESAAGQPRQSLTFGMFVKTGLLVIAVTAIFNGTLKESVIAWVPTYIQDTFGFTSDSASLISTLLPVFSVAGPYIGIWLTRRFTRNECTTVGILYAVSAVCNLLLFLLNGKLAILAVVLISISQCCMWGVNSQLLTYVPYHFSKLGLSSAVTGTLNCIIYIGCSACTVVFGRIADAAGNWTTDVLLWTVMATAATVFSLALAKVWTARQPDKAD